MKLNITEKQLDELSKDEKWALLNFFVSSEELKGTKNINVDLTKLSIGQMIEYLGNDWANRIGGMAVISDRTNNKLCDLLWEAVKYKLKI